MPLVNRQVCPVYLSKQKVSSANTENELDAVCNNTLVQTVRQMASLVRFADDIFSRVYGEFCQINERSEKVRRRLVNLCDVVDGLDAKTVEIPEGDLDSFVRTRRHFRTNYDAESLSRDLFLPDHRPQFISDVYDVIVERPLDVIRSIEAYRQDGDCKLRPFVAGLDEKIDMDIEIRKPANLMRLMDSDCATTDNDEDLNSSTETLTPSPKLLPSPEEVTKATAEGFPAAMVPIDITGSGFKRMTAFRRSLVQITFLEKRRKKKKSKRRNTICEGESTLKREVQDALTQTDSSSCKSVKRRSLGLFSMRRKSADMLDDDGEVFVPENMLSAEKKCVSTSCQTEDLATTSNAVARRGIASSTSALNDKEKSKSNRFLSGFLRASRSKFNIKNSSEKTKNAKRASGIIPISTLSQAMNVAVKMRDSSRTGKSAKDEDRNSSSGNWSASSSTRTSFDSDSTHKNVSDLQSGRTAYSQSSRDSAVLEKEGHGDIGSQDETTGASGYTSDSTVTGTMSTRSFAFHPKQPSKSRTNTWLNNHSQVNMNLSVDDQTSDGDTTPVVLSPFSRRRSKNPNNLTDDESSVYSVDTDGYYTSMHTDSGLRGPALPSPPPLPPLPAKDAETSDNDFSNADTICIRRKAIPPPPPKRTSSRPNSMVEVADDNKKNSDGSNSCSSSNCSETTDSSVATSESDHDARSRLRNKTAITSTKYPSMVHVSESEDDVDIKTITYPSVSPSRKLPCNVSASSASQSQRPSTLNLKHISEHDVPMLKDQYGMCRSPVPSLYCDSLLRQKAGLKRSQSMKQEPRSPLLTKSAISVEVPERSYPSNSLGRRRTKYPMNVESTVAAQLPMSKKYSTLPSKLKYNSVPNDNTVRNTNGGQPLFNSYSLDRRSLRSFRGSRGYNTSAPTPPMPSPVFRYPVPTSGTTKHLYAVPIKSPSPVFQHPPSSAVVPVKTPSPSKVGPAVAPKPKARPKKADDVTKPKKATMTAQDLFAAIHNSKKKLNIKSDPCMSPLSSRCTSPNVANSSNHSSRTSTPSCVSPTPSLQSNGSSIDYARPVGSVVAETGFLSPRGGSVRNVAGERRSWAAGSRATPPPPPPAEKKSYAMDRLKNRKPTSIQDFKKLLLQTKTSPSHQRSAAEILRATSPVPKASPSSPANSKYFKPIAPVPLSSPSRPVNRCVSPFKRGNRLRSSLPTTSIMTSPIWEDSCESETISGGKGTDSKPLQSQSRAYAYLRQGSPQSPRSNCQSGEAILHIPTRSALESSV